MYLCPSRYMCNRQPLYSCGYLSASPRFFRSCSRYASLYSALNIASQKWEDEIFLLRHRIKEQRPDSFAEQQAQHGRETAEHLNSIGEDLFQVLQGNNNPFHAPWLHADIFTFSQHTSDMVLLVSLTVSTLSFYSVVPHVSHYIPDGLT